MGTASDRAVSSLLFRLQQKKQERWEEAVNSIDFSHSSCKAWRTINKLTGRSGCSSHQCSVSANSIASQLVKKGTHKTSDCDCESTRLVNKQLSDLWKIPTPESHTTTGSNSIPLACLQCTYPLGHVSAWKSDMLRVLRIK